MSMVGSCPSSPARGIVAAWIATTPGDLVVIASSGTFVASWVSGGVVVVAWIFFFLPFAFSCHLVHRTQL